MKFQLLLVLSLSASMAQANLVEPAMISEVVYVESPTDTDSDGQLDRIYVSIQRPNTDRKLSSLFHISPYATGGNDDAPMHNVDMDLLPQDEKLLKLFNPEVLQLFQGNAKSMPALDAIPTAQKYAQVEAHSVGTGRSTGCPTVGDMNETLAAKAVIDWLNGRAEAFDSQGKEVKADWANGKVGMTGTSYDGTLPIMVATTGVEGLKAIIPVAAISSWYDYYRANGLVVNPGGYIGEDADVLGKFIVRRGTCQKELTQLARDMGREHGDFTKFWQDRDYLSRAKNIKAAVFLIHGQSDWNVKQKHAIQLWEALEGVTHRRIFLHRGGHSSTWSHNVPRKVQDWFDHFLEDEANGITEGPQVEVELPNGKLMVQESWPHEDAQTERLYLSNNEFSDRPGNGETISFIDSGSKDKMENLIKTGADENRLLFLGETYDNGAVVTGTVRVNLELAVMNRRAANLTVALVEYDKNGNGKIITRGWADPQNHADFTQGELLVPGQNVQLSFNLEPKQFELSRGSRLGVVVASTDFHYTLRPKRGTELQLTLGGGSYVEIPLLLGSR